ncbi:hypothetical protein BDW02DRAFT_208525 [Decorospora gaudefroyi]|uniref:RNI-like protein n=1 Tax=Decorospora gaudefroyi TaxID=184978 RepID=A0A6A5KF26_9PLEO|nr:hypothetical protein BDW02DRAFT_208525 [Decorospora gaudefroyi]
MAAAATATADNRIVALILHHLSDMKYKDRRQPGPDQPVEFLEFRPTLVPSILVNKLWAEEGTSILWKRYPHLPALQSMTSNRRQWYANKVESLFVLGAVDGEEDLTHLEGLEWPNLKTLELEIDWKRRAKAVKAMLHAGLERLEFLGPQSGDSHYIAGTVLPALFAPCTKLRSIHFGPDVIDTADPVHNQELSDLLDSVQTITDIRIINTAFFGKDTLFGRLSQRPRLEALEIDLDPGLQLLSCFSGPNALPSPFSSLKRLHVMCYPEMALALPVHLPLIEEVQLDIARIPNERRQDYDMNVLDDILGEMSQCPGLQSLRVNIGQLAADFPSAVSYPYLSGVALVKLAASCPKLQDLNLLVSDPAAIDGSMISSLQFEAFCRKLPRLLSLSLKLHPQTAINLEATALESLGRNCPQLETLRLKISLQLPSLQMPADPSPLHPNAQSSKEPSETDENLRPPSIAINGHQRGVSLDAEYFAGSRTLNRPLFESLTHLAFSRPQSILSIASDSYTVSSNSQSSSIVDPIVEEDLVQSWAQPLATHFPRLEVLEAWGDWTGQDNELLNYFLPQEELLASTWEFLSGMEQDLWEDGEEDDEFESEDNWVEGNVGRLSINSRASGDWELASLVNEFPQEEEVDNSAYTGAYDEEPEGMITPGRTLDDEEEAYIGRADVGHIAAPKPVLHTHTSGTADSQVV